MDLYHFQSKWRIRRKFIKRKETAGRTDFQKKYNIPPNQRHKVALFFDSIFHAGIFLTSRHPSPSICATRSKFHSSFVALTSKSVKAL